MGLAASQGRLLLLTARKSDLEYRAQEISQRRLLLATQLEDVATKFARKSANRQMKLATIVQMNEANQTKYINLTYDNLIEHGKNEGSNASTYRIRNAMDQIVVPADQDISGRSLVPTAGDDGKIANGADFGYAMKNDNGEANLMVDKVGNTVRVHGKDANGNQIDDTYVVDKKLTDKSETENMFQEGLKNGDYIIEKLQKGENDTNARWTPQAWSGMNEIEDANYTDDDATAQAEYQAASARVQALDKKLEMEQKQIETQHKAVETEVESVQKVIQNNIEGTFKMFS